MDEELITKKDLLEQTGISYGALYRWKRMKLLPDEWFIRRSTYTGHETFFPREKILARVAEIQQLKEHMSLELIAKRFQPEDPADISMTAAEAASLGIAEKPVVRQFQALRGEAGPMDYTQLLRLSVFNALLQKGTVSGDEALSAADTVSSALEAQTISEPVLYLLRRYGVCFCAVAGEAQPIFFDPAAAVVETIPLRGLMNRLNTILIDKGVMK